MPTENPYLDGTGSFVSTATNAGTVKFASFDDSAVNTGVIAISATFTGTAVNSGVIGDVFPTQYATFLANNSANWDSTYNTVSDLSAEWMSGGGGGGGTADLTAISDVSASWDAAFTFVSLNSSSLVDTNDSRLSDERTPVAHTHGISDVTGLQAALDDKQASGDYATLVDGKVPSNQLPSYVDDVIEADSVNDFPATGESSKIYVSTGNNKTYRWSGSAYVEISSSPGSTDSVTEGSTNLYFTDARAKAALQSTVNTLSTDSRITLVGTNSARWNNAVTTVSSNSANWNSVYSTVSVYSTNWNSAYSTVSVNSTYWNSAYSTVNLNSARWNNTVTTVSSNSANWQSAYNTATTVASNSANWQSAYTTVSGKANISHTHTASQITDFDTSTDARIAAAAGVSVAALVGGTVPASQLPSYVDDVLEYTNTASFPATGETGKIYIATSTNKSYRWSGSVYIEIASSPGSTDGIAEGSTNLYFTNARAIAALQSTINSLSSSISSMAPSTVKTLSATTYTLLSSDANAIIRYNSASDTTITIPSNIVNVGTQILLIQIGVGKIITNPSSGVVRYSPNSATKTVAQYAVASLIQTAQNEWLLTGDVN